MRLSQILCKWPRNRPHGYIWNGKHQMVRKVTDKHLNKMEKQIEMVLSKWDINIFTFHDCRRRTTRTSV